MNQPSIYVFCPDLARPMGGVRMLYRHVDILNANGFDADIVHSSAGFRVDWFEHSTRVLLEEYEREPGRLKLIARDAGRFVRDSYSPEAERQSVVECWGKLLQARPAVSGVFNGE